MAHPDQALCALLMPGTIDDRLVELCVADARVAHRDDFPPVDAKCSSLAPTKARQSALRTLPFLLKPDQVPVEWTKHVGGDFAPPFEPHTLYLVHVVQPHLNLYCCSDHILMPGFEAQALADEGILVLGDHFRMLASATLSVDPPDEKNRLVDEIVRTNKALDYERLDMAIRCARNPVLDFLVAASVRLVQARVYALCTAQGLKVEALGRRDTGAVYVSTGTSAEFYAICKAAYRPAGARGSIGAITHRENVSLNLPRPTAGPSERGISVATTTSLLATREDVLPDPFGLAMSMTLLQHADDDTLDGATFKQQLRKHGARGKLEHRMLQVPGIAYVSGAYVISRKTVIEWLELQGVDVAEHKKVLAQRDTHRKRPSKLDGAYRAAIAYALERHVPPSRDARRWFSVPKAAMQSTLLEKLAKVSWAAVYKIPGVERGPANTVNINPGDVEAWLSS